ncbi:ABC transporter permease [Macrococcus sp. DPC7161]|uniref:ABC transporter permease n=1 Tax=Macrococcus sp. DPC7161 TaxID=2507060 RepID=UPI00100B6D62|nr:FtsX-like permease family protein [Macrococcus sp. DPC7161]RXK17453.1 ABC transporter permease [Macrococcus sp. DPC7161]
MFLALKEVLFNKLKFGLIIGVLVLISYLLFLVSGLSIGLMNMNKESIDKWKADAFVVTDESNQNLAQSLFKASDVKDKFKETASIKNLGVIIAKGEKKQNTMLFGIDKDEFLNPNVVEGKSFSKDFEVVADDTLKEKGFKVGDELDLAGTDETLKIVGFTDQSKYNAAPIVYANMHTADVLSNQRLKGKVNALVIRDSKFKDVKLDDKYSLVDKDTFIKKLPGFTEQKLTLDIMSYFLFAISACIIGIFLYIITIQKAAVYGLLKAQGISTGFLARSLVLQTFVIGVFSVLIALLLTYGTQLALPPVVPIKFDLATIAIYAVTIIVMAVLGGLFSIRSIQKVDPLKIIN